MTRRQIIELLKGGPLPVAGFFSRTPDYETVSSLRSAASVGFSFIWLTSTSGAAKPRAMSGSALGAISSGNGNRLDWAEEQGQISAGLGPFIEREAARTSRLARWALIVSRRQA